MSAGTWRSTLSLLQFRSYTPTTITYQRLLVTRVTAVSTFTAYICSQMYALYLSGPNPPKPYSPNDSFVVIFFALSALVNVYWLRQLFFEWDVVGSELPLNLGWDEEPGYLWKGDESAMSHSFVGNFGHDGRLFTANLSSAQVRCIPFSIAGNMFMAAWGYAWSHEYYTISQMLLTANLATNLYAVFMLLHVDKDDHLTPTNYLTHLVMKTSTGLAVLYTWKNWGVIDQSNFPSVAEMINSGVIFLLMTIGSGPDPTLGICLLYTLAALISGETTSKLWYYSFHWISLFVGVCLLVELKLSKSSDFSWLKGFDESLGFHREQPGKIHLEKDVENGGQPSLYVHDH